MLQPAPLDFSFVAEHEPVARHPYPVPRASLFATFSAMTDARQQIATLVAAGLRAFAPRAATVPVLVGFDGFVDSIIQVVNRRNSESQFDAIPTIAAFGEKISAVAGKSGNFELVRRLEKLGGNGPIMANALAAATLKVTYVGATGHPAMHPAFDPMAKHATVIGVADPGMTDALEFDDGKLMLGKYDHLSRLNYTDVARAVGDDRFADLADAAQLIATVNWTMMPHLEDIWKKLKTDILEPRSETILFVDLADPAKHPAETVKRAVETAADLRSCARVVLGMNLNESSQVAAALGIAVPADAEAAIEQTAEAILRKLDIDTVVIHPRKCAAAARQLKRNGNGNGGNGHAVEVERCRFVGPFTDKPKLSTGAGDNFNAGFCLGLLAGLPLDQCLCTGTATSGYYVRNAASPTILQLAEFCDALPD